MKRPEGFDHHHDPRQGQSAPEARDDEPSTGLLGGLGRRLGRGRGRAESVADDQQDGLEARPTPDSDVPSDVPVASRTGLPELPDVSYLDEPSDPDATTGASATSPGTEADGADASRASRLAGVAGRRLGAGLSSVRGRFRELSPDEDFVDPDAPAPRTRTALLDHDHDRPSGAGVRAAETARDARAARKRRRAVERQEVRRFTRRSRHRRAIWVTTGSVLLVLVLSVVVAVYSPLMALTKIEVKGTSRVDQSQVLAAVDGQLGTPLARIDFGRIKQELGGFPLIESYVTSEAPPHTLVITVTEREPIVAVKTDSGYDLVDPAGIIVESDPNKPDGMPLADVTPSQLGGAAYRTLTDVVLALPATIRSTVTDVTATTSDDVTLTLNSGAKVVWGSPDDSDAKAALLAALVKDHDARNPGTSVEYDVSAPDNGIIRTQG